MTNTIFATDRRAKLTSIRAKAGVPTLRAVTYTGGRLYVDGYDHPVILDLRGYQRANDANPILADHQKDNRIGTTTEFRVTSKIVEKGILDRSNEEQQRIIGEVRAGRQYQPSIGATPVDDDSIELIPAGTKRTVNGKRQSGPFYLITKFVHTETSIVERGGDLNSSVAIAARQKQMEDKTKGQAGDGTGGRARTALKRLTDAGMSYEDISRAIGNRDGGRDASTLRSIGNGDIANPPESLIEILESINPPARARIQMTRVDYLAQFGHTEETFAQLPTASQGVIMANFKEDGNDGDDSQQENTPESEPNQEPVDVTAQIKRETAAELRRIAKIKAKFGKLEEGDELAAKAIEEDWDEGRQDAEFRAAKAVEAQLGGMPEGDWGYHGSAPGAVIRNQMQTVEDCQRAIEASFMIHRLGLDADHLIIRDSETENATDIAARLKQIAKGGAATAGVIYESRHIEAALNEFAHFGFPEMFDFMNQREGNRAPRFKQSSRQSIRAALTSMSQMAIFQNVCNHMLVSKIPLAPSKWRRMVNMGPGINDFEQFNGYRIHIGGCWEKIECGDSVPMTAKLGAEDVYHGRADMYGQMAILCFKDMVGDNVGALSDIANAMIDSGLKAPRSILRRMLKNNVNYDGTPLFDDSNTTFLSEYNYGPEVIQKICDAFCKTQTTGRDCEQDCEAGDYLDLEPNLLLGPKCGPWSGYADAWNTAEETDKCCPADEAAEYTKFNRYRNKFDEICPWNQLNDCVDEDGNPTMLFAFADNAPFFEMRAFENQQRPVIEMGEPDFKKFDVGFRGWWAFALYRREKCGAHKVDFTPQGFKAFEQRAKQQATVEKQELAAAKAQAKKEAAK